MLANAIFVFFFVFFETGTLSSERPMVGCRVFDEVVGTYADTDCRLGPVHDHDILRQDAGISGTVLSVRAR